MAKSWGWKKSDPDPDPIADAYKTVKPGDAEVDAPHTVTYVDSKDPKVVYGTGQCWCRLDRDH